MVLRATTILYLLLTAVGTFLRHVQVSSVRMRKPIYNIVHMVNSIDKIDGAMSRHANGIQMDVEFLSDGTAGEVHYGSCNCLPIECERRQLLVQMLDYIRQSTHAHTAKYGKELCIVVLHLKLEPVPPGLKYKAGSYVAEQLVNHLWYGVPEWNAMDVLMSVKLTEDIEVIRGANDTVNKLLPIMVNKIDFRKPVHCERIGNGYDARDEPDLGKLKNMYKQLDLPGNFWQGEGKSTCILENTTADRLQTILDERDTDSSDRYANKVYHWVIDMPADMKRSLLRGVDAIITNRPSRLHGVLKYALNQTHRLATIADSPWKWFDGWTPFLRVPILHKDHLGDDNLKIVPGVND